MKRKYEGIWVILPFNWTHFYLSFYNLIMYVVWAHPSIILELSSFFLSSEFFHLSRLLFFVPWNHTTSPSNIVELITKQASQQPSFLHKLEDELWITRQGINVLKLYNKPSLSHWISNHFQWSFGLQTDKIIFYSPIASFWYMDREIWWRNE